MKQAYDEMLQRILGDLDARIRERDKWLRRADEETEGFWLKMRAKGLPTRSEERDAYQRLADDIREIGPKESGA